MSPQTSRTDEGCRDEPARRRFVIGVDISDPAEDATVTDVLTEHALRWWHWTRGMWLVVSDDPTMTANSLAEKLNRDVRISGRGVVVLDADDPRRFAGFVAAADGNQASRFLREEWAGTVRRPAAAPAVTP